MSLNSPCRTRAVGRMLAAVVLITLVSSCSSANEAVSPTAPDGMVAPKRRAGGVEVTIPALWADVRAGQSGIEPAKVWVNAKGSGKFSVDLTDIEAEGAGNSWRAASASAAMVGTMISGVSPAGVDINFAVTGSINGPSAGGILTVAILAALLEAPLRDDVTMTGTISADGSLGRIGGVALKLKAAAEAGYRTVLLPPANMTVRRADTDEEVSAVTLGAELGLEVIEVADIQKAFAIFGARDFSYPELPPYQLPDAVVARARATTDAQLALIEAELAAAPPGLRNDSSLTAALAVATRARDTADLPEAYGLGVETLLRLRRSVAEQEVMDDIAAQGEASTARLLRQRTADLLQRTRSTVDTVLDEAASMGYERLMSTITALGWPVYAVGALRAVDRDLATSSSVATLRDAALELSDLETNLDVQFADAMAVVRAMPTRPVVDTDAMAEYLSIYGDFLMRAAQAESVYLREVLLSGQDLADVVRQSGVLSLYAIVVELGLEADVMQPEVGTVREELNEIARALVFFLGVTSLVAAVQSFGIDDFRYVNDTVYVTSPEALRASVRLSKFAVEEVAKVLAYQGLDAGYAVWSAQWGAAAYEALRELGREGAGGVLALEELWYSAVNVFMMRSGPVSGAENAEEGS